jgi:hypothetical protein
MFDHVNEVFYKTSMPGILPVQKIGLFQGGVVGEALGNTIQIDGKKIPSSIFETKVFQGIDEQVSDVCWRWIVLMLLINFIAHGTGCVDLFPDVLFQAFFGSTMVVLDVIDDTPGFVLDQRFSGFDIILFYGLSFLVKIAILMRNPQIPDQKKWQQGAAQQNEEQNMANAFFAGIHGVLHDIECVHTVEMGRFFYTIIY